MKKLSTLFFAVAVGACLSTAFAEEPQPYVATVTAPGTLETTLGDKLDKVKELKVVGPVNEADFITMWKAGMYGTELLDLSEAVVEGGVVPAHAFSNGVGKPVPEGTEYPVKFRTIMLGESVREIGAYAFATARRLENVMLPQSVRTIGEYAFYRCGKLNTVNIPEGVEILPEYCFSDCYELTHIALPSTLKRIGRFCMNMTALCELKLPAGLEVMERSAFSCGFFPEVIVPAGCRFEDGGQFSDNDILKKVVLPEGMTEIPDYMFSGCNYLEEINFPSTLTSIGAWALSDVSLKTIRLPEGLRRIEQYAFSGLKSLHTVVLPSTLEFVGGHCFKNSSKICRSYFCSAQVPPECEGGIQNEPFGQRGVKFDKLYIYEDCFVAYIHADGWGNYFGQNIIPCPKEVFDQLVASEDRIAAEVPAVTVRGESGAVVIEGGRGESFAVVGADGRTAAQGRLSEGVTRVSAAPGVYIVKAGQETRKVAVR